MNELQAALDETQLLLYRDRRRAHATLFGGEKRRSHKTPDFHWEMIDDFHSSVPFLCDIAFRDAAKSTIGEEGTVVKALFREFMYCLIVSSTSDIAEMRLHAIKRQFETNESILEIFGNLRSQPWGDNHIELSTGVVFRAIGRGQALRGTKDENVRPDFLLLDDLEDLKSIATQAQVDKTRTWFFGELLGSTDMPNLKARMLANDMGASCLANRLKDENSGWVVKTYPWVNDSVPAWPDRFPLPFCLQKRAEMYALGAGDEYEREFMCNSARSESRVFQDDMLKIDGRVRTYEPVFAMMTPALDNGDQSAPCGCAVWSWSFGKIVVWEAWARNLSATEFSAEVQRIDSEYTPVHIGFPLKQFNDWISQIVSLPNALGIKAPHSAADFIRALQPYLVGKQIIFATDPGTLWQQMLNFPNGAMDGPLALASALHPSLHLSSPMFEDFAATNVFPDLSAESGPMMLALNADSATASGVLCQVTGHGLRIFADWIESGDVVEGARKIFQSANVYAQRRCEVVMPQRLFERLKDQFPSALRRMGIATNAGGSSAMGRNEIRKLLRQQSKGLPSLVVSDSARWTRAALSAGYQTASDTGIYKLVGESIEAMTALASLDDASDPARMNAMSRDGRSFFSVRPQKHG